MKTSPLLILLIAGLCTSALPSRDKKFYTSGHMSWTEAQAYCRRNYTDLLTVQSQEEMMQVLQEEEIKQKLKEETLMWIGLKRRDGMKWSNGDNVNYHNYTADDGREKPYCHTMPPEGHWEKIDCSEKKPFMCYDKGKGDSSLRYTLIQQNSSWCEAQRYCREHHTDLVSIYSSSQNAEVQEKGGRTASFWIGLMQADWEWSDGDCSVFRNWNSDYPKNDKGDCGHIIPNGKMQHQECIQEGVGICYKDQIHLITETKTWKEALEYCLQNYKGLLRIESLHDQRRVEVELRKRNVSEPVWLGLRQDRLFGFWFWPNGENVGWSNWKGGSQPDQPLSQICGAIAKSGPGEFKWSDQDCLSKSYFLCEGIKH